MYINHFDTNGSCAEIGYSAEDMFEQWLIQHNRVYRKATLEEQYQHIDFVIEHPETKEIVTVDIKAPKKRSPFAHSGRRSHYRSEDHEGHLLSRAFSIASSSASAASSLLSIGSSC